MTRELITHDELMLAGRNKSMPLEAMRYDTTPVGAHYLLVHYDIPMLDAATWRLAIGGRVARPISLGLDELRARPRTTSRVTLECAGNGRARLDPRPISQPWLDGAIGTAEWTGTPLRPLLDEAGLTDDAIELVFTGADHGIEKGCEQDYARSLAVDEIHDDVVLAYEMNGRPLEPQHGFPVRLLVPGWYGMTHVKWLTRVDAVATAFDGYQQRAYRYRKTPDDPGEPVTRIRPRALLVPPGFPDFLTRTRIVERGRVELAGRAWSGMASIAHVEIGIDGVWREARLGESLGPYAWRGFAATWDAEPGDHTLSCRATDAAGNVQPLEQPWNVHGMGNNLVQQIAVTVR